MPKLEHRALSPFYTLYLHTSNKRLDIMCSSARYYRSLALARLRSSAAIHPLLHGPIQFIQFIHHIARPSRSSTLTRKCLSPDSAQPSPGQGVPCLQGFHWRRRNAVSPPVRRRPKSSVQIDLNCSGEDVVVGGST